MAKNILKKIINDKYAEVAAQKKHVPLARLKEAIAEAPAVRSLSQALTRNPELAVLAEIKKASPSAGLIRPDFSPGLIAAQYAKNDADALSILTDAKYFQGNLAFIAEVRPNVDVPVLRKEFIVDAYQIYETRAAGADAILLIIAALEDDLLTKLLEKARELGVEAIVEVHNNDEMIRALQVDAQIIGINNRNLETFVTDLSVTEKLASIASPDKVLIGESGISTAEDVQRMAAAGVDAVLVGSHFMQQPDPGQALATFKKWIAEC